MSLIFTATSITEEIEQLCAKHKINCSEKTLPEIKRALFAILTKVKRNYSSDGDIDDEIDSRTAALTKSRRLDDSMRLDSRSSTLGAILTP